MSELETKQGQKNKGDERAREVTTVRKCFKGGHFRLGSDDERQSEG